MRAAGHDLTPVQFAALRTLAKHSGLDQASLAAQIAYDRATIGGVVARLEQKGLIARQHSKTDKRAFVVRLTDQGAAVLATIDPIVAKVQDDILAALTASERADLVRLIQKALDLPAD